MIAVVNVTLLLWHLSLAAGFGVDHQIIATFVHEHPNVSSQNLVASATMANPLSPVFQKYVSTLSAFPLPTKMLTGAALATAGDAIAQTRGDEDYDPSRGASFAAFDMIYRAAQHYLFPIIVELCRGKYLLSMLVPIGAAQLFDLSTLTAMERSLASQLIIVPFLYYPVFFTLTGYIQGLNLEEGITRAKQNFFPLMKRNLLFWVPVQFIQFCYIPTDLQIPFLSCAGLAWTFTLSILAGRAKSYSNDEPNYDDANCAISEDESFPVMFNDFKESDLSGEQLISSDSTMSPAIKEKKEGVRVMQ
ncbi:hypothetical protein HJC23_008512 [Cyclotella cryptica]|uniref:Uncharacterized protein n=1 Tax=Cyclotella cryptica TaxID=29204 RepID=A0ABD3QXB2_9STRA|eukprot:CCRYP_001266-RA/>CCRYP_001266-RA protein AED:0.00 eAED:0.00 QI:168/-1/1/1/-1/1/1/445/303